MKPEDKELLLKDLCARLPYGVKYECSDIKNIWKLNSILTKRQDDGIFLDIYNPLDLCKPYLFPLSSITEEQEKELLGLGISYGEYALHDDIRGLGIMVDEAYIFFEFCYKHHIDFLGLIPKGLAKDATGLNIY